MGSTKQLPPAEKGGSPYLAVGSVAAGAVFCAPPLAILGAVLAIKAFRSKVPQHGGRATATTGLILSCFGLLLLGWILFVLLVFAGPVGETATSFLADLSKGDVKNALSRCESTVSIAEVEAWSEEVGSLGAIQRAAPTSPLFQSCVDHLGERRFAYTVDVRLTTGAGEHDVSLGLLRHGEKFYVVMFQLRGG